MMYRMGHGCFDHMAEQSSCLNMFHLIFFNLFKSIIKRVQSSAQLSLLYKVLSVAQWQDTCFAYKRFQVPLLASRRRIRKNLCTKHWKFVAGQGQVVLSLNEPMI